MELRTYCMLKSETDWEAMLSKKEQVAEYELLFNSKATYMNLIILH